MLVIYLSNFSILTNRIFSNDKLFYYKSQVFFNGGSLFRFYYLFSKEVKIVSDRK